MDIENSDGNDALNLSLANGKIELINALAGQFKISIPAATMQTLSPGVYNHDLIMTNDGLTQRIWQGTLADTGDYPMSTTIERLDNVVLKANHLSLPSPKAIKLQLVGPQGLEGSVGSQGVAGIAGQDGLPGTDGQNGAGYGGTSTTANTVETGTKSWQTQSGFAYATGQRMRIINSSGNWLEGVVTSYVGTTLVLNVTLVSGTGAHSSWSLGLVGEPGSGAVNSINGLQGDITLPVRELLSAHRNYSLTPLK